MSKISRPEGCECSIVDGHPILCTQCLMLIQCRVRDDEHELCRSLEQYFAEGKVLAFFNQCNLAVTDAMIDAGMIADCNWVNPPGIFEYERLRMKRILENAIRSSHE